MDVKKLNKRIEIKNESSIKMLIVLALYRHVIVYIYDVLEYIPTAFWTRVVNVVLHMLIVSIPFIYYIKKGLNKEHIDLKNWKQYVWGIILVIPLYCCKAIVFGVEIFENKYVIGGKDYVWLFVYYMFVVAITEEFFYREYMQGELEVILGKARILAPAIAAACFGWVHIVNCFKEIVYMTFLIGLVLGYAKMYIKNCTFISVIIAHGLYDLLVAVTGW